MLKSPTIPFKIKNTKKDSKDIKKAKNDGNKNSRKIIDDIVDKKKSPTDIINDILNRKNSKDNNSSLDLIYNSLKK